MLCSIRRELEDKQREKRETQERYRKTDTDIKFLGSGDLSLQDEIRVKGQCAYFVARLLKAHPGPSFQEGNLVSQAFRSGLDDTGELPPVNCD